jgi:hypothetical protein
MYKLSSYLFILLVTAVSCEFKAEIKTPDGSDAGKKGAGKIRNGITLKENHLKVSQAFLLREDDGTLLPESNEVGVNKQILMRLIIDSGFTNVGEKVFPGAAEKVETSDGKVLMDEKDLFSAYPDGVSKKDAGTIGLYVKITSIDKLYDYYLVSFRVWDKKGTADVTGSYKLHIQ